METLIVEGGHTLQGTIDIEGNKNAALPMLAATLLTSDTVTLHRIPCIRDVMTMKTIIEDLGGAIQQTTPSQWVFHHRHLHHSIPHPQLSRSLRASFALAGPLLAREGRCQLPVPGGDRIGRRPLDTHMQAFQALGAHIEVKHDHYAIKAPYGLHGADIFLEEMSVLATENAIMAAVTAKGTTILRNAASEPHVQDLCHMLIAMGAHIEGIGTQVLNIEGVNSLHGADATVGPDYLEVGSFIALAAMTGGSLHIRGARPQEHRVTALAYQKLGIHFLTDGDDIVVPAQQDMHIKGGLHGAIPRIHDAPWPGFPADLMSIAIVLATQCTGTILMHEWMYESRLYWVDRLISMGARIVVCDPHRAMIEGKAKLYGQTMASPDIRAGMALLLAALVAEGTSTIHNAQQIDRGYANIDHRLRLLGAKIERQSSPQSSQDV